MRIKELNHIDVSSADLFISETNWSTFVDSVVGTNIHLFLSISSFEVPSGFLYRTFSQKITRIKIPGNT